MVERDPVCGMRVDPNEAAAKMEFEGRTYYFCSEDCRHKFELNPREYALPRGTA